MAIYTRTGDSGKTSLFGGKRVLKSDIRVEAYGTIDELNSAIGCAVAEIRDTKLQATLVKTLEGVQNDLLDLGSSLATPEGVPLEHLDKRPQEFEKIIDEMTNQLPPLTQFILPGGGRIGSQLHLARTICRRAERRIIALSQDQKLEKTVIMYVNRLSDLLFTMARFINHTEKQKETVWKKS